MATNTRKPRQSPARRILRFLFLWVLFPLCLLLLALTSSLYLLCTYKPELVAASVQQQLNAATGLPWRIRGGIRPALWPYPGINASDVRIMAASAGQQHLAHANRPMVHAKNVLISLDPASLWTGNLRLHLIELNEPVINLDYDAQQRPLWIPLDSASENAAPVAAMEPTESSPSGAALTEVNPAPASSGQGDMAGTEPASLPESSGAAKEPASDFIAEEEEAARNLRSLADALCSLPPMAFQPVSIRNGSLMSWTSDGRLLLSFTDVEARFIPEEEENLSFSAAFDLPDADLTIRFSVNARVGCEGIPARGRVNGQLDMSPPGSKTLSALFSSGLIWQTNGKDVLLPDFHIVAEGDSLTADLVMDLAGAECTGKVLIEKLSLTRWFGWGRSLPPGLRETLHHLTGSFDLQLDGTRAEAHNLRAEAANLEVRGYVGTPDFSAPVVVVDIDLDRALLDPVFPFLAAVGRYVPEPKPPVFDHPPLAPYPRDPSIPLPPPDPDDPGVGYDIAIRVARPRVHDVDGGPLLVTVRPVTVDGLDKCRVGIKAERLLEGGVDGYLDIDDDFMLMHYDIKGMELALLPENEDNIVRIAGKVTGVCDIDVPFLPDGDLAEDWQMRVDAAIRDCTITGLYESSPWQLYASTAKASGASTIHAVLENGVRIEGLWNLGVQGVNTSWHHKGHDAFSGTFSGGLFWPPITGSPGPPGSDSRKIEKKGVERVRGELDLKGSLVVPMGSLRVPLTGRLDTRLDWLVYGETIALTGIDFNGLGSYFQGRVKVDFSGREVIAVSDTTFKVNPRELLESWKLLPPPLFLAPKLLTGKMEITGKSRSLRFDNIKVEADGAPITGEITWQDTAPGLEGDSGAPDSGHWSFKLTADHLDIDNVFPPDPPGGKTAAPSMAPWNLAGLKDLSLDARLHLNRAKREKLSFTQTTITATLQKNRFTMHCESGGFYDGTSTLLLQGSIVPEASQVTLRKWLMQLRDVNFAKLLQDYTGDRYYGGIADMVVDVAGTMTRDADFPAKLSGVWNLSIKDGMYPAFLSGENSTLRNTFSLASASGTLDKGTIRSNNFTLSGPMVDISGHGWYDLNYKTYDLDVSATFAKVPTVPMRFYGNASEHRMNVRGADMVVETVQAAGSTVFGLVRGIISLPGHAVRGIGGLFGGEEKGKKVRQPPQTMPISPAPSRGRPVPVYPQP